MNALELEPKHKDYIKTDLRDGVLVITMDNPKKLNGWTMEMMDAFKLAFVKAGAKDEVKAIVFTAEGSYFSAGVNLGSTIQLMAPKKLHQMIVQHNQALFDAFLDVDKPILVAVNGPAIGASVTSATLCNDIIAAEEATFSTPFHRLSVPPEGCSSKLFPLLLGDKNAQRMLGEEGWTPNAKEAQQAGLIQAVVPQEQLVDEAVNIAKGWIEQEITRSYRGGCTVEELKQVNAKESLDLASAFLSASFLFNQCKFLWSKKKYTPALMFFTLTITRPVWGLFL